jgi:hypothetical protein
LELIKVCFSATASFTAAATVGIIGVATFAQTSSKKEWPLASIPFLFGLQQLTEGFVWLSLQNPYFADWNYSATFIYSLFSHVLWPAFVPIAILGIESDKTRQSVLNCLVGLGLIVSGYLLFFMFYMPLSSEIANHSIRYNYHHHFPILTMSLYLGAVLLSCFISSDSIIRIFGMTLLISFIIAYSAFTFTFFSVWCFFSALLSLILFFYFRRRSKINK